MTLNSGFVSLINRDVGSATTSVYTYLNPTSDKSYCSVTKNEVIEAKLDDVLNSEIAFMSTSCSAGSACTTVDIKSSSTKSVIKFKIKSTFGPRTDLIIDS